MISRKTLQSGQHFYENCPPVMIISHDHRSFSNQHKIQFPFLQLVSKMVFFHFLELLKLSSMWNITWTIIFNLTSMTSQKNVEIRTALLRRPPSCKRLVTCLTIIAVFLSTRFSSRLCNSCQ